MTPVARLAATQREAHPREENVPQYTPAVIDLSAIFIFKPPFLSVVFLKCLANFNKVPPLGLLLGQKRGSAPDLIVLLSAWSREEILDGPFRECHV